MLATFLQRLLASILDHLLFGLPLLVFGIALFWTLFISVNYMSSDSVPLENGNETLRNVLTGVLLASVLIMAGYVIWWLFALRGGQTPGKQLAGIRVIKSDGSPSGWGFTFLREFIIKGMLGGFLSSITGGIYWVVDHLWTLFDGNSQALHDKMMNTLVVQSR